MQDALQAAAGAYLAVGELGWVAQAEAGDAVVGVEFPPVKDVIPVAAAGVQRGGVGGMGEVRGEGFVQALEPVDLGRPGTGHWQYGLVPTGPGGGGNGCAQSQVSAVRDEDHTDQGDGGEEHRRLAAVRWRALPPLAQGGDLAVASADDRNQDAAGPGGCAGEAATEL